MNPQDAGGTPREVRVVRMDPGRRDDFRALHCNANGCGWCQCVAWWVPTWDGWGERTAEENRTLRDRLFDRGEYDGYLLYADGIPAAWCQVGPRDRLEKLARQYGLAPDPGAWAVTCFQTAPAFRRRGLAARLLREVLADLPGRGARRVEAFPKRTTETDPMELWTGPEELFRRAGFRVVREGARGAILAIEFA